VIAAQAFGRCDEADLLVEQLLDACLRQPWPLARVPVRFVYTQRFAFCFGTVYLPARAGWRS
jgi:hypothetical protein